MLEEIVFPKSLADVAERRVYTFWERIHAASRAENYKRARRAVSPEMRERARVATRKTNILTWVWGMFNGATLLGGWWALNLKLAGIVAAITVISTIAIFAIIYDSFWKGIVCVEEDSEAIVSDPLRKLESLVLDDALTLKNSVDAYNHYVRLERVGRLSPQQTCFFSELRPKLEKVIQHVDQRREFAEAQHGIREAGLALSGSLPRLGIDIEEMEEVVGTLSELSQGALMSESEEALRNEDALLDLQRDLNSLPPSLA